jgi:C-terminal processing protease CtpA/Prc
VTKVDGEPVASLPIAQIVDRIRGKAGTPVKLDVTRGSRHFTVDVERREVHVNADAAGL